MSMHPFPLAALLQQQSWRHLLAILAAHQLSITTSKAKSVLVEQLALHLAAPAILASIVAQLSPDGKDVCTMGAYHIWGITPEDDSGPSV